MKEQPDGLRRRTRGRYSVAAPLTLGKRNRTIVVFALNQAGKADSQCFVSANACRTAAGEVD
jgi:hypothetical protein